MGGRRPTIREVAKRAGVSVGTVSRALNGYDDVADQTRAHVLQIAAELEYRPAAAARSLVMKRSQVIGVFLETGEDHPDLQHPFFQEVLVGLKGAVGRSGYDLLLFARHEGENDFGVQSCLDRCRQHGVDGVVVMGAVDDVELRRMVRSELPCMGIDLDPGGHGLFVSSDNVTGGELAVDHLYRLGHRRIATIAGLLHTRPAVDRLRGYRDALQARGLAFRDEYVAYGDYYIDSGRQAMARFLALGEPPTAVAVASDLMALGALRAVADAGLRVPADVSIVGYDDISLAEHLQPPLTTIRQDKVGLGNRAGRALVARIEGGATTGAESGSTAITVSVELVVRRSTSTLEGFDAGTLGSGPVI